MIINEPGMECKKGIFKSFLPSMHLARTIVEQSHVLRFQHQSTVCVLRLSLLRRSRMEEKQF